MTVSDWSAPPKSDPPEIPSRVPWVIDRDPRDGEDGVRIYEVIGVNVSTRCIAKDVHPEDAQLIVSLYDKHREAS